MALNMFIQCPACSTRYEMPDGSIKADGRKVRCASCKNVWQAYAEASATENSADNLEAGLTNDTSVLDQVDIDAGKGRINLKVERTTDDDLMAFDEELQDNSQDDIDALFDTPSAEEFGGVVAEEPITPVSKPPNRIAAVKNWLANKSNKRRELKALKIARLSKTAKKDKPNKKTRQLPVAASLSALVFVTLGGGAIYRETVVSALPQSAKLYQMVGLPVNLRGVIIQNVSSRIALEQGNPELTVEGEITNVTRQSAKLSRLRFAIRSENGREIYSWKATADKPVLEPGESVKFKRKLSGPPEEGHDVLVRFETKGDMVAGVQ